MFVDVQPWLRGTRSTQEQQDAGGRRWEMSPSLTLSCGHLGPGLNLAPQHPASTEVTGGMAADQRPTASGLVSVG